jgi:hypothetical protein
MSEVKRYEIGGPDWEMDESPIGEYVTWDDHNAECQRLRAELAALKAQQEKPKAEVCMGCVEQSSRIRELEHKMDYYKAQQVGQEPVALVLPEPMKPFVADNHYASGFNDALNEVLRLNTTPQPAPAQGVAGQPMQPIVFAEHGVIRFKQNAIVRHLLDYASSRGCSLNELARMDFSDDDRMQLAQLIGYSVSGYGDLSYASRESVERADEIADALAADDKQSGGEV